MQALSSCGSSDAASDSGTGAGGAADATAGREALWLGRAARLWAAAARAQVLPGPVREVRALARPAPPAPQPQPVPGVAMGPLQARGGTGRAVSTV